ncbi:MAG: universal stress protein [Desulfofustis sp.]|nr:universal stress protein [Desulfofustis sp.]
MQITSILLPVDGSSHSDHAVDYAAYLAKLTGAHITAVNCYEWLGNFPEVPEALIEEMKKNAEKSATEILAKATLHLQTAGVGNTGKTIAGAPGSVLTELAKSGEFDLIIMGSHGHSEIAGLFLGSVTHKVLNTIYCPVMVVP